jgi:hypothetical protein
LVFSGPDGRLTVAGSVLASEHVDSTTALLIAMLSDPTLPGGPRGFNSSQVAIDMIKIIAGSALLVLHMLDALILAEQ